MTTFKQMALLLCSVVLTSCFLSGCGYNTIQTMDENIDNNWAQVQNQLQRRSELLPNLVKVVKSYASHEKEVFEHVADARAKLNQAVQSNDPNKVAAAEQEMNSAIGRLLVVVENYPNLKADKQYTRLMDELAGTENRIAVARKDFNDSVRNYNGYIRRFPQNMTAKVIQAEKREYYEPPAQTQAPVEIDL